MRRAMTLIELIVSIALGIIITGVAALVFMQSQKLFVETNARVELSVYMRSAVEFMRRDLSQAVPTSDMEFYRDANADGSYSAGEELAGQDPAPGASANTVGYNHAMSLCRATYARTEPAGTFRCDALYFRVDPGPEQPPYLVEYRLQQSGSSAQFIRRVTTLADPGGAPTTSTGILLDDVLDLKFEFLGPQGQWQDAGTAGALGLRTVSSPEGDVVELCVEGSGSVAAGGRVLRATGGAAGLNLLQTGDGISLVGGPPGSQGVLTVADRVPQGGNTLVTFEERFPLPASASTVQWRAAWMPGSVRALITLRSRRKGYTNSFVTVFEVR